MCGAIVLLAFVAAACIPEPPPPPPPSVVVYGDSLTAEAESELRARLAGLLPGHTIEIRSFAGTAQCDWHQWMQDDAAALSVVGVVISFTGNRGTPCMAGWDAVDKYTVDATWAVDFWSGKGVPVMFVAGPTRVGTLPAADEIGNVYRAGDPRWGVHFCGPGTSIPGGCSAYSSGVVRFAEAIVHGVASLLDVPHPPSRTMVTPTTTTTTTTTNPLAPSE